MTSPACRWSSAASCSRLVVEEDDRLRVTAHVVGEGTVMVAAAEAQQLEGVVAKRIGSPYVPGRRTDAWRKIKLRQTQDCVILGSRPGQGGRGKTFGALLVGAYDGGELRWVGQVGSGFSDTRLADVLERLQRLVTRPSRRSSRTARRSRAPCSSSRPLVCEVEYLEMTKSTGKMRAPVFKRMRERQAPARTASLERLVSSDNRSRTSHVGTHRPRHRRIARRGAGRRDGVRRSREPYPPNSRR